MAKLWGPDGSFLGTIGDVPVIMPGDTLTGCVGAILAPIIILLFLVNIPNIVSDFKEVEAEHAQAEADREAYKAAGKEFVAANRGLERANWPNSKTPAWMKELPVRDDWYNITFSRRKAIDYAIEYHRRWHPGWVCITNLENIKRTSEGAYVIRFKRRHPKSAEERKSRRTFIVARKLDNVFILKSLWNKSGIEETQN